MELNFDIAPARIHNGNVPKARDAEFSRELLAKDLTAFRDRQTEEKVNVVQRITQRHHALARLIAEGTPTDQAGVVTGYNRMTVRVLLASPAFQDLVAFYQADVAHEYASLHSSLASLALDANEELRRRLEDAPEDLSIDDLKELVKLGADRTGAGTVSTQTNINVNANLANRMREARAKVIDAQARKEKE